MSRLVVLFAIAATTACATGGATFRSGVGDRFPEHPPHYAGAEKASLPANARIAVLPIVFQNDRGLPPGGAPRASIERLIGDMNAFLDSLGGLRVVTIPGLLAPNVYFGCERDAIEDCVQRGDSVLGRKGQTMRLALERPSKAWSSRAAALADSAGASHLLVLNLELSQYWPRQSGLIGSKSVELGTGYVVPLPWLTSLETPVGVLQVTGALVDPSGRGVRIGAEGVVAQRTSILASGMGLQRLFTEEDIERVRTLRHDNITGQPLVWRVALCHLLTQLAGKAC